MMERLKAIKEQLIAQVEGQMSDLRCVDAEELGEVIDMIYDLSKSMYYCSIVEAMEDAKENEEKRSTYYYMEKYLPYYPYHSYDRDDEYKHGRMYYDGMTDSYASAMSAHDAREGGAGQKRKMYMESKAMNHDQPVKMQELDEYMKELTSDITEMIAGASPEEKALLLHVSTGFCTLKV